MVEAGAYEFAETARFLEAGESDSVRCQVQSGPRCVTRMFDVCSWTPSFPTPSWACTWNQTTWVGMCPMPGMVTATVTQMHASITN
jgi:hypothetical protein